MIIQAFHSGISHIIAIKYIKKLYYFVPCVRQTFREPFSGGVSHVSQSHPTTPISYLKVIVNFSSTMLANINHEKHSYLTHYLVWYLADMIFVKTFTRPEFSGPKSYTKMRKLKNWQIRDKTAWIYIVCVKVYTVCVRFTQNCEIKLIITHVVKKIC